jgi:hypothetical protein
MIGDAQTHSLPASEDGFARLAAFMGTSVEALVSGLTGGGAAASGAVGGSGGVGALAGSGVTISASTTVSRSRKMPLSRALLQQRLQLLCC